MLLPGFGASFALVVPLETPAALGFLALQASPPASAVTPSAAAPPALIKRRRLYLLPAALAQYPSFFDMTTPSRANLVALQLKDSSIDLGVVSIAARSCPALSLLS